MGLTNYRAEDVQVIFGPVIMEGFGEDAIVTIAQNEESFTLHKGADGQSTRAKTNNKSARVTATIAQSSGSNTELSAIHNIDIAGQGDGINPLTILDLSGVTLNFAAKAWIVGMPEQVFNKGVAEREWVFETGDMDLFAGGNLA